MDFKRFKLAVLQCADTGPMESLAIMLRSVGIASALPSQALQAWMRKAGADTVLDNADLVRGMGYEPPLASLGLQSAGMADLAREDCLLVDVKAHRNLGRYVRLVPSLAYRTLWYRINGGMPEVVKGCGDEVDPPCPVLTPNQWYGLNHLPYTGLDLMGTAAKPAPWAGRAYCCWPPYARLADHVGARRGSWADPKKDSWVWTTWGPPLCLVHNASAWGCRDLIDAARAQLGVRVYGAGSPDGLLPHTHCLVRLDAALAMVHLKTSDAPGYALYEAAASGCPMIVPRALIWKCRMREFLEEGVTCLCFGRESHDHPDVEECLAEIKEHLDALARPERNAEIGRAARNRLERICWSDQNPKDVSSLRKFLKEQYS